MSNITNEQSSYRQIMKATSLFGGVQVFQIIIQVIRSKFVAVLLGPSGMGIAGLLMSTIGLIAGLTNFGLGTSAVKNVAEANETGNVNRIATVITIIRRLVWLTGVLGMLVTMILSPWLSQITFGNRNYTLAFIWISITLLFNQLTSGQLVLLQGMRKLQYLAKANLFGSVLGLIITVPLYYKLGLDGIVPGIIITSVISFLLSFFFSKKIDIVPINVSKMRTIAESKSMLTMGFMISLSGLITIGAAYIVRIFISRQGGIADVGLYNAGFVIIETYVGMVFTAMGADYFPRLSAVNHDNKKIRELVNQQSVIALLIIMPIVVFFLIFSPIIIQLLYSKTFLSIEQMISLAIIGTLFRAVSWSMGFILFAKSDSKLFIMTALGFNSIFLLNNIVGYILWGLTGLGVSFMLNYLFHLVVLFFITKYYYQFSFTKDLIRIFFTSLFFCILGLVFAFYTHNMFKYLLGILLIIATLVFSYLELDKRLKIKELILNYINK